MPEPDQADEKASGRIDGKATPGSLNNRPSGANTLRLNSPFRLPPPIREALAQIVDSLNEPGSAMACRTTAHGIFIPLAELQRRSIEPSLALRTLGELRMLVQISAENGPIVQQDFGGAQVPGFVLRPDLVDGLDADAFISPA